MPDRRVDVHRGAGELHDVGIEHAEPGDDVHRQHRARDRHRNRAENDDERIAEALIQRREREKDDDRARSRSAGGTRSIPGRIGATRRRNRSGSPRARSAPPIRCRKFSASPWVMPKPGARLIVAELSCWKWASDCGVVRCVMVRDGRELHQAAVRRADVIVQHLLGIEPERLVGLRHHAVGASFHG